MTIEYREVLIGADCAASFEAAVESAAELARILELGLSGLFVEEEELLALSDFPFSRLIGARSGRAAPPDPEAMRRALAREAMRLRAELERCAARAELRWRFETARGRMAEAVARAAQAGDIVVLPTAPGLRAFLARLQTARGLLDRATGALLAHEVRRPVAGPVLALIDAATEAEAAALAARLAAGFRAPLSVRIWGGSEEERQRAERRVRALLGEAADVAVLEPGERLEDAAPRGEPRVIVSGLSVWDRLDGEDERMLIRAGEADLLLLRDRKPEEA